MQTKLCSKCGQQHPVSLFGKDKHRQDGLFPWCKSCHRASSKAYREKNKARTALYMKAYYEKNKDTQRQKSKEHYHINRKDIRAKKYLQKYGITKDQAHNILSHQDFQCKICKIKLVSLSQAKVDHCHTTGIVRGILCNHCNLGLGHFKDSETALQSAVQYLASARAENAHLMGDSQ